MTRYEYVKKYEEYLRQCAIAGLEVSEYQNLRIYEDTQRLRADGLKMQYCVNLVCSKYQVSEATVWRIVRRYSEEV